MQITLKSNDGEIELPMRVDPTNNAIILTIKSKDYSFNLADFDDSEKFLKEKCGKTE